MKIQEAIEILNTWLPTRRWPPNQGLEDAMKLGIEALKRVNDMRISPCTTADEILSGESEE